VDQSDLGTASCIQMLDRAGAGRRAGFDALKGGGINASCEHEVFSYLLFVFGAAGLRLSGRREVTAQ